MAGDPYELRLTRRLAAPAGRVFQALTQPDDIARWWGPLGFAVPAVQLDLRVGGGYRFTMQPTEGEVLHVSGEFLEIAPPTRLAYTFRWDEPTPDDRQTVVALTVGVRDTGAELSLHQRGFATEERLELHRGGWTDSFAKLAALLATTPP